MCGEQVKIGLYHGEKDFFRRLLEVASMLFGPIIIILLDGYWGILAK
jgi:hypothetical protein